MRPCTGRINRCRWRPPARMSGFHRCHFPPPRPIFSIYSTPVACKSTSFWSGLRLLRMNWIRRWRHCLPTMTRPPGKQTTIPPLPFHRRLLCQNFHNLRPCPGGIPEPLPTATNATVPPASPLISGWTLSGIRFTCVKLIKISSGGLAGD